MFRPLISFSYISCNFHFPFFCFSLVSFWQTSLERAHKELAGRSTTTTICFYIPFVYFDLHLTYFRLQFNVLLCCLSDLTNFIAIIVVLNPLASGCENSHTIGPRSLCLLTVAQRIDGIGVHNVCIQVTVGMISEDVSTLLFELRKKCYLSCFWLLVLILISCGFPSTSWLFSLLHVLVLLEFGCLFVVVVQSLLFLCHLFSTSLWVGHCQVWLVFRQTCFWYPLLFWVGRHGCSGSAAFHCSYPWGLQCGCWNVYILSRDLRKLVVAF